MSNDLNPIDGGIADTSLVGGATGTLAGATRGGAPSVDRSSRDRVIASRGRSVVDGGSARGVLLPGPQAGGVSLRGQAPITSTRPPTPGSSTGTASAASSAASTALPPTLRAELERSLAAADGHAFMAALEAAHVPAPVPLEALLGARDGEAVYALWDNMSDAERRSFTGMLMASDLTGRTRARLVSAIVDDHFYTGGKADFVDAMTRGLLPRETREFLGELDSSGHLESFLEPRGFWATLLSILTLGIFNLFMSDNRRAKENLGQAGYGEDRIRQDYDCPRGIGQRIADVFRESLAGLIKSFIPEEQRGFVDAARELVVDRSIEDLRQAPDEFGRYGIALARGAANGLMQLLRDVENLPPAERQRRINEFLAGLSPEALAEQVRGGDIDGSLALLSKRVLAGALQELLVEVREGGGSMLTLETIHRILADLSANPRTPILGANATHPLMRDADMATLRERMAFFQRYTGLDARRVQIYYGGMAELGGAPAITTLSTVSINRDNYPLDAQGRIVTSDHFFRTMAFHEMAHVWQQARYGLDGNSFIDQGISIAAGGGNHDARNAAYEVDPAALAAATSIDAFRDHWEQQAEIIEWTMQLLWDNRNNPAGPEAYPGDGRSLPIGPGNSRIPVTPELWGRLMGFMGEMRDRSRMVNPPNADGTFNF